MDRAFAMGCLAVAATLGMAAHGWAFLGQRWPSEKKIVMDPTTGVPLEFLTSTDNGARQSKIYQTHRQWTCDGKWVVFRGNRGTGPQAFAVNEQTGDIVQVTENGFIGMLCVGNKTMKLYVMQEVPGKDQESAATIKMEERAGGNRRRQRGPREIVEINLERVFTDSAAGKMGPLSDYQRVCGVIPEGLIADGNMGLDANDDVMYFKVSGPAAADLSPGQTLQEKFGPRNMGAGPSGLRSMDLKTGEVKTICNVGFQIGHVQANPWAPGEIIFCWETGGKAPQRTWFVKADGSDLKPLYAEAPYDWVTHEAFITKDEAAIAILGHRGMDITEKSPWGLCGNKAHATGVGIVNVHTGALQMVGQVPMDSPGKSIWHVNGSADGRWAVADDFSYELWVIDRHSGEMQLLCGPQNVGADHIHPTFNADGTKVEIQSALISKDKRSLNICVVPLPKELLERKYPVKWGE